VWPDRIDLPLPFQLLEEPKLRRPVDEVVDLVNLDAAKQAQRVIACSRPSDGPARPDFVAMIA